MENQINTQESENPNKIKNGFFSSTKRKVILALAVFLFLTASFAGVSFAKKLYHLKTGGPIGVMIDKVTEDMNLTNDQKAKITALKNDIKAKMEAKKDSHQEKLDGFLEEFKKDNLDKATLENMYQQHDQDRTEMKDFAESKIIEFHNILTPEQRRQASDKMIKLRDKFHEKMESFHSEH
jgi:Spy/CpxP family protein refolding chaperone